MKQELDELKTEIRNLKKRIAGLEKDLDYQVHQSNKNDAVIMCIRELQEEVAKMANQPVAMLFTWLK
jgi:cell division septum initiation protein DivIVA